MIAQHSSLSNEHYTPTPIVERARRVLGDIDLDPASSERANEHIKAGAFFTCRDSGLEHKWTGRVFLNPPGGKRGGASSQMVWWNRLATHYRAHDVSEAIFIGFTLEILRLSQRSVLPVQAFSRCYPKERLAFTGSSPTHANVIVFLAKPVRHTAFAEVFGDIGLCERGMNA